MQNSQKYGGGKKQGRSGSPCFFKEHPGVCVCVWWRFVVEHQGVLSGWKITWLAIPPTGRVIYGVEEV